MRLAAVLELAEQPDPFALTHVVGELIVGRIEPADPVTTLDGAVDKKGKDQRTTATLLLDLIELAMIQVERQPINSPHPRVEVSRSKAVG